MVESEVVRLESELAGFAPYDDLRLLVEQNKSPSGSQWAKIVRIVQCSSKEPSSSPTVQNWARLGAEFVSVYAFFLSLGEGREKAQLLGALVAYRTYLTLETDRDHFLQTAWHIVPPSLEILSEIREASPTSMLRDFCGQLELVMSRQVQLMPWSPFELKKVCLITPYVPFGLLESAMLQVESPDGLQSLLKLLPVCRLAIARRQSVWSAALEKARLLHLDLSAIVSVVSPSFLRSGITDVDSFLKLCSLASLNMQLRRVVLLSNPVDSDCVSVAKHLLDNGASPLQRDGINALLITNVRASIHYSRRKEAKLLTFRPGVQHSLIDLLSAFGANWSTVTHRTFADDFKSIVFTLLCCNFRLKHSEGSIYLPRDPMGLVIGQLAGLMYASEESQYQDTLQLLSHTYSESSEEELIRECQRRESSFGDWCKKTKGLDISKRGFQKKITREELIEFLVFAELDTE